MSLQGSVALSHPRSASQCVRQRPARARPQSAPHCSVGCAPEEKFAPPHRSLPQSAERVSPICSTIHIEKRSCGITTATSTSCSTVRCCKRPGKTTHATSSPTICSAVCSHDALKNALLVNVREWCWRCGIERTTATVSSVFAQQLPPLPLHNPSRDALPWNHFVNWHDLTRICPTSPPRSSPRCVAGCAPEESTTQLQRSPS